MEIPSELFWLSALLFAALSVHAWFKMHREQTKMNNIVFTLTFLGFTWSIFAAFNQIELAALAWISAMIISVIMLPELNKHLDEQMLHVNVESPIKLHEYFTGYSGWLKLAHRHGVWLTVIVYFMHAVIIAGILLATVNYFFNIPATVSAYSLTVIPLSTFRLYQQIQKMEITTESPITVS